MKVLRGRSPFGLIVRGVLLPFLCGEKERKIINASQYREDLCNQKKGFGCEAKHNQEGRPDRSPKGCLIIFQIVFIGPVLAYPVISAVGAMAGDGRRWPAMAGSWQRS